MADNVEKIKERLSIEEVVSWYASLKPAGGNLKARCPFHAEKTPSFMVSPARGTYHCFGCGVGGDMFSFVQAVEGVDFMGALTMLAERAGVTLTFDSQTQKSEKDVLYALMADAVAFYETQIGLHESAYAYVLGRGMHEDTIRQFRLGFAPDSWEGVRTYLLQKKYTDIQMERAGLVKRSEKGNGYYDRFRSRIMFPINDSVGRPVGFSGRIFGKDDDSAKYINSPETELYDKSAILFGFDKAKQAMRRNNFVVLVEGQMDLVLSHQIKYANTVALSGTALSENHVRAIGRLTKNMVIALDADKAGIEATKKSATRALRAGFDVKVTRLPDGQDPADVIKSGGQDVWKERIKEAVHVIPFLFAYVRAHTDDERSFALRAAKEVLPFVRMVESPVDRAHFVRLAARELMVSEQVIEQEIARIPEAEQNTAIEKSQTHEVVQDISPLEHAVQFLLWQDTVGDPHHVRSALVALVGAGRLASIEESYKDDTRSLFRMEELYGEAMHTSHQDILFRIERAILHEQVQEAGASLKKAESVGERALIETAMHACEVARKALSAFESRG